MLDRALFKKKEPSSLLTVNVYQSREPMKIYQHNFLSLQQQSRYWPTVLIDLQFSFSGIKFPNCEQNWQPSDALLKCVCVKKANGDTGTEEQTMLTDLYIDIMHFLHQLQVLINKNWSQNFTEEITMLLPGLTCSHGSLSAGTVVI